MTPLKPTHPVTVTLSFLLALGCSSHVDVAEATGGSGVIGATTGGHAQTDGGASATIGGAGGSIVHTGGAWAGGGTGGSVFQTGTGGFSPFATGGMPGGGSLNTGGTHTAPCCFTTCDPGDIQIDPSMATIDCYTGTGSCYTRSSDCCGTYFCVRTNNGGNGGSGAGGAVATGGKAHTGGTPATGGVNAGPTGGVPATGGKSVTGVATGGDVAETGGNGPATGGVHATGGVPATGGVQATGGAPPAYPHPNCTYGADQTCNDYPTDTVIEGQCDQYGWCTCNSGYEINKATGKCNIHEETVCYSPTQNIDIAYVDRAFGCKCDPVTSPDPYCGIDSSGLRVRLVCTSSTGRWQSGGTSACN